MLTQAECILTKLLNCGIADLSILEDVNYDLDDILDDLVANNILSFTSLVEAIFYQGIYDLTEMINDCKADVIAELEQLEEMLPKSTDSDEVCQQKVDKMYESAQGIYLDEKYHIEYGDDIEKHIEEIKNLSPEDDIEFYINYLDTHIWFRENKDVYKLYFAKQVSEIEDKMGFEFYN